VTAEVVGCPECQSPRVDPSSVCPTCGAPPIVPGEKRLDEEVRTADLEPYVTLRYIAKLFKVLAVLMLVLLIGEIIAGLTAPGAESPIYDLIGEITRMLVLAGLLWSLGDLTLLIIDAGHDVRVARILLGRINAELHRRSRNPERSEGSSEQRT